MDALLPQARDYVVWCGKLPGFGCRVRLTGYKTFIVMYRVDGRNATTKKVTIGTYGKITVEQARDEASKVVAKAELGEDIAAERARVRAEMTLPQLCDQYLREGVAALRAEASADPASCCRLRRTIAATTAAAKRCGQCSGAELRSTGSELA